MDDHLEREFRKVPVYNTAFQLVLDVHDFTRTLPHERRIDLANKCFGAMAIVPAKIVGSRAFSSGVERANYLDISLKNLKEARRFMTEMVETEIATAAQVDPFLERMDNLREDLLLFQRQSLAFNTSMYDDETVQWMNELSDEDEDPLDNFSAN